jgi:hypothetical protein
MRYMSEMVWSRKTAHKKNYCAPKPGREPDGGHLLADEWAELLFGGVYFRNSSIRAEQVRKNNHKKF